MAQLNSGEITIQVDPNVQKADAGTRESSEPQIIDRKLFRQWLGVTRNDQHPKAEEQRLSAGIFTVPKTLTIGLKDEKAAEAAFKPQIVSLGPFHFREHQDLTSLGTKIKSVAVRLLLAQLDIQEESFFFNVVDKIKAEEQSIRDCYDRCIELDSEVLSWMMARDAIFILQFLRQRVLFPERQYETIRGAEFGSLPLAGTLNDILKLENQIPLSVLRIVLRIENEMQWDKEKERDTRMDGIKARMADGNLRYTVERTCRFVSPIKRLFSPLDGDFWLEEKGNHILALLRSYAVRDVEERHILCDEQQHSKKVEMTILPSAVGLHRAGIKFKPCHGGIDRIHFDERNHTLYLPMVEVGTQTQTVMRNMMAYELCSSSFLDKAVTRYVHFMDQLIHTEKDIAVLRESGIIYDNLGSDSKVAILWNSLCESTWIPSYPPIDRATTDLKNVYQARRWRVFWNDLLENKPWHFSAFVGSILLLVMTAMQTFCLFYTCNTKL